MWLHLLRCYCAISFSSTLVRVTNSVVIHSLVYSFIAFFVCHLFLFVAMHFCVAFVNTLSQQHKQALLSNGRFAFLILYISTHHIIQFNSIICVYFTLFIQTYTLGWQIFASSLSFSRVMKNKLTAQFSYFFLALFSALTKSCMLVFRSANATRWISILILTLKTAQINHKTRLLQVKRKSEISNKRCGIPNAYTK